MIQRKQSLWLLIAALLNGSVFFLDVYSGHVSTHTTVNGADSVTDTVTALTVPMDFPSLLVAVLITVLPLVAIFMFKQRRRQILLATISIAGVVLFTALQLMRANTFNQASHPVSASYQPGAVLPAVSIVFLIMAIMGVRRDEKLVKSVDRLR